MEPFAARLKELYDKVPRRHSAENMQVINSVIDDYADLLGEIEVHQ